MAARTKTADRVASLTVARTTGSRSSKRSHSNHVSSFDPRNLPTLDPRDFQWGTATTAQQHVLCQQYMQYSFMYGSPLHPMCGVSSWPTCPMPMPACPVLPAFHPSAYCSGPPNSFLHMMPPMPAAVAAMPVSTHAEPASPTVVEAVVVKAASSTLSRLSSDASDETDCCRDKTPGRDSAGLVAPATNTSHTTNDIQLSEDELHALFADDSFLLPEELETSSADESSLSGLRGAGASGDSSLASHCTAARAAAADSPLPGASSSLMHLDPDVFFFEGGDTDNIHATLGLWTADDVAPAALAQMPALRFPAGARGVRKARRRASGAGAVAFAVKVAALLSEEDSSSDGSWLPVRAAPACLGVLSGGVRKAASSASVKHQHPPAAQAELNVFAGDLTAGDANGRMCDEWDAVMALQLDTDLGIAFDVLE